jgi:hypothetical protein
MANSLSDPRDLFIPFLGKCGGEVPQTFLAAIQSYAKLSP